MKLLGSTEKTITNAPHLEITEALLVHCNVVHNNYKQDSRVVCKFVVNFTCNNTADSFKFQEKETSQTSNNGTKTVGIMVLLKYISNLWKTYWSKCHLKCH